MIAEAAPGLDRRCLLAVYTVTPLLAMLVGLDIAGFDGRLRELLPHSPVQVPYYSVVFGFPHVLASFFLLADRDLARAAAPALRPAMIWSALLVIVSMVVLDVYQMGLAMILSTMVHVLGQQTGLAAGQAGLSRSGHAALARWATAAWRWLLAGIGCAAGIAIGGESMVAFVDEPGPWLLLAGALLLMATPLAAWLGYYAHSRGGDVRALVSIQLTVLGGFGLLVAGYPLLSILLFRCVHDATAFMVYGALANARARTQPGANRLYALLGLRGSATGWCLWPLAILLAVLAAWLMPVAISVWLIWSHYLAEHRMWRAAGGLRRHLTMR